MKAGRRDRKSAARLLLAWGCLMLIGGAVVAQTIQGSYPYKRSSAEVEDLLQCFKDNRLDLVPGVFFRVNGVYDRELADLVVFIDRREPEAADKEAKFVLLKNDMKRKRLFGEKFIYVLVFVAEGAQAGHSVEQKNIEKEITESKKETTEDNNPTKTIHEVVTKYVEKEPISVTQSTLASRPGSGEFILSSVIKSIATILTGAPIGSAETAERTPDIRDEPLKMSLLGVSGETRLLFGYVRAALSDNTINRITVKEVGTDKTHFHLATFGNYSRSRIAASIGVMGTRLDEDAKTVKKDRRTSVDAFILANFYLKRPQVPGPRFQRCEFQELHNRVSISLVIGTRLSKELFDDLFVGLSLGHLVSSLEFIAGFNIKTIKPQNPEDTTPQRKLCPSFGIGLIL